MCGVGVRSHRRWRRSHGSRASVSRMDPVKRRVRLAPPGPSPGTATTCRSSTGNEAPNRDGWTRGNMPMTIREDETVDSARPGFGTLRRIVETIVRFFMRNPDCQANEEDGFDPAVWNSRDNADPESVDYETALVEQYKLYTELTDRISQRRDNANARFFSLNGAALVAVSGPWATKLWATAGLAILQLVLLLGICVAWHRTVRSHRQLSSAKWRVVCTIEERLPVKPWTAEWALLGHGKDRQRYWKLTRLEQWAPVLFGCAYAASFALAISA